MQNDLSNKKIKDSEIFLDLIYKEHFEQAIKWLNNKILPLVAQSRALGQNKPMDRDLPLEFSAEKENHLIKDELNLIKFQSGKYRWESFVPKGKLVKVYKKVFSDFGLKAIHSMDGFLHRDTLVKWFIDNFFRSYEFDMIIFDVGATRETITILKNDKITIYLTDNFPAYDHRIKKAKLSLEKVKHETAINWMLKKIRKVAHLSECEVMALVAEQKKQSGSQWVEKDGIFEIAIEHGVDFSTFKTVGESGLIVGEASIKDIIEKINFTSVPLSELYSIFESDFYGKEEKTKLFDEIFNKFDLSKNFEDLLDLITIFFKDIQFDELDKTKLFYSIVDRVDISKNFVDLLDLIIHFEDEYYQSENDYYGVQDYRFYVLEDFYEYVLKNHPEVIMQKFPEVLDAINNSILSDSYFRIYVFRDVIFSIKNTDIMKKHFSLIEDEFKKLLDYYYGLDDSWFGKHAPNKSELFILLEEIVEGTEFLRRDVPNYSNLIKIYPTLEQNGVHYAKNFVNVVEGIDLRRFEEVEVSFLVSLYSLIEGYDLTEFQYLSLINNFDGLLDKFDEIQRDEEVFSLFSKFFKALKHKKLALTEKTLKRKISIFTTNLSLIKEISPEIWKEYERNKRDQLPKDLYKLDIMDKGYLSELVEELEETSPSLERDNVADFKECIELILQDKPISEYSKFYLYNYKPSKFELKNLIGLIEELFLTESQWSNLLFIISTMIDNFYTIQADEDSIHLFDTASSFVKVLLQKKPELIKKIFVDKISLYIANLNAIKAIKKKFPKEWNEFLNEKEDKEREEIKKILREEFE